MVVDDEPIRASASADFSSSVCQDGLLDDVVAQEEVGGDDVGRVPPQITVPAVHLRRMSSDYYRAGCRCTIFYLIGIEVQASI